MLKLTMSPRKRTKRHRAIPHRLRIPTGTRTFDQNDEMDQGDQEKGMLADNVRVLIRQENTGKYSHTDYLYGASWQENSYQLMKKPKLEQLPEVVSSSSSSRVVTLASSSSSVTSAPNTRIDEYCREQIVEWSFRVVDYFRIDREVVAVSLSFLDRFLAACRCDRTSFKLAATTTLHLAVKLLYPCKLADLGILSDLSRGEFDMQDVCRMEGDILQALSWNLHPPTSVAISSIFLDYFFASRVVTIASGDLDDMYDVSSFFCELAVCDYFFVMMKPSIIALAAILNALEGMFGPDNSLSRDILHVAHGFRLGLNQDLAAARSRLWELYERSEECALHNETVHDEDHQHNHCWQQQHGGVFVKKVSAAVSSPVSVTKPCHPNNDFNYVSHDIAVRNGSW